MEIRVILHMLGAPESRTKCLSVPFQLYQNTVGVYLVMSDKYREKGRKKQVISQYAALLEKHKEFFSEGLRAQD